MVNVFPLPVYPYIKTVPFIPSKAESAILLTNLLYISILVSDFLKH